MSTRKRYICHQCGTQTTDHHGKVDDSDGKFYCYKCWRGLGYDSCTSCGSFAQVKKYEERYLCEACSRCPRGEPRKNVVPSSQDTVTVHLDFETSVVHEEIECLKSIFGDDVRYANGVLTVTFDPPGGISPAEGGYSLVMRLPSDYPDCVPSVRVEGPYCSRRPGVGTKIAMALVEAVLLDMEGCPVLLAAAQWLHDHMVSRLLDEEVVSDPVLRPLPLPSNPEHSLGLPRPCVPCIFSGDIFRDRKSGFQAHIARVASMEELRAVVNDVRSRKGISDAAHPAIYAYRFVDRRGYLNEDRDDDGETGAGDRLLHLLQRAGITGWVVVVTRWFGGTLLGPDRFRHIVNVAKVALQQEGACP